MNEAAPVYIIGGGWSGLSAAIELCRKKIPVTVIEAAKQLGGKSRRIAFDGMPVDQSQLMMFGGYSNLLSIFRTLKIRENQDYERIPFDLVLRRKRKTKFRFRLYGLPAPYGVRAGLYLARGVPFQEKIRALRLIDGIHRNRIVLDEDISVSEFLMQQGQRDRVTRFFWRPLCRMFLHTEMNLASAQLFIQLVSWLFLSDPANGDVLLMRQDMSSIFSDRAMDYIEQKGGMIKLGHEVTALDINNDTITGVKTDDAKFDARHVILANAWDGVRRLLAPHTAAQPVLAKLDRLVFSKLTTVYVKYPSETALPMQIIHTMGALGHWVLDQRVQGKSGTMAVCFLVKPQLHLAPDDKICEEICAQLSASFPYWKAPLGYQVVHTPDAMLANTVRSASLLVAPSNIISGLWLAGDFVDTRLLPSVESAVCSARECARQISSQMGK